MAEHVEATEAADEPPHATLRSELSLFVHHRYAMRTWLVLVALIGATLGILIAGSVNQRVGPVDTTMSLRPASLGDTQIDVPPLGNLGLDTHDGPLQLKVAVDQVRPNDARALLTDQVALAALPDNASRDLQQGLIRLAIKGSLVAVTGTVLLTAAVYRRRRQVLIGTTVTLIAIIVSAGYSAATWNADALKTPHYTGLLTQAPAAIGDVQDLQTNFSKYRVEISKIVTNVSKLYDVTAALPSGPADDTVRLLFVADIHDNPTAFDVMSSVIKQFNISGVVDAGDISDHGTQIENSLFAPIRTLGVPYVYVRGNHDSTVTAAGLATMRNVTVLDNTATSIAGIRIAGSGDPLFTPDQSVAVPADQQTAALTAQGALLAAAYGATPDLAASADVVLVHEPPAAIPLFGRVPLVLAGHTHERRVELHDGTEFLVQGSTGGAGLRALEHPTPTPVDLSVLYFNKTTHKLVAYDDLRIGGLGLTSVEIQRHDVPDVTLHVPGTPLPPPISPSPILATPMPTTTSPLSAPTATPTPSTTTITRAPRAPTPRASTPRRSPG